MKNLTVIILSTFLMFSCNNDSSENKNQQNKAFANNSDVKELDGIYADFNTNGIAIDETQVLSLLGHGYNFSKGDFLSKAKIRNYDLKVLSNNTHCGGQENSQAKNIVLKNDVQYFYINENEYDTISAQSSGNDNACQALSKPAIQTGPLKIYKYNKNDYLNNVVMRPAFLNVHPKATNQYFTKKNQLLVYFSDLLSEEKRKSDDRYAELYTFDLDNKISSIKSYRFSYEEIGSVTSSSTEGMVRFDNENETITVNHVSDLSYLKEKLKYSSLCVSGPTGSHCSFGDNSNLVD